MPTDAETLRERLRDALWAEISSHYARSKEPLLLSNVGFALVKKELRLPGGTQLRKFLEDNLGDRVRLERSPNEPTVFVVALRDGTTADETKPPAETSLVGLAPRPLLLAFYVNVPEGESVYYCPPRSRYSVGVAAPDESYIEVEAEFRIPGHRFEHVDALDAESRRQLEENIRSWTIRHGIKPETIKRHPAWRRSTPDASNALQRLLQAQTEDVRRQLLIPGDIADRLMRIK